MGEVVVPKRIYDLFPEGYVKEHTRLKWYRLYDLAKEASGGHIVELGSSRGWSTTALALGTKEGHDLRLYCVEPHEYQMVPFFDSYYPENRRAFLETILAADIVEQVRLINLEAGDAVKCWRWPIALLYWDYHLYRGPKTVCDEGVLIEWATYIVPGGVFATVILSPNSDGVFEHLKGQGMAEIEIGWPIRAARRPE